MGESYYSDKWRRDNMKNETQAMINIFEEVLTLADVSRVAQRPPGAILCAEDLSQALPHIKNANTYIELRFKVDSQSAQRRLWDDVSADTRDYLEKQVERASWLLRQLELPAKERDPMAQIEINGHKKYFKISRNWR